MSQLKKINPNDYARIAILLDCFGHDTNGNPIAQHTVFAYADASQALSSPTAELYKTRRRQQIGAGTNRDDWAPSAMRYAGLPYTLPLTRTEGSRAEGAMWLVYDLQQEK